MNRLPQPELVPYPPDGPPVEPLTMPHYIPVGNFPVTAELTTDPHEDAGWNNPNGMTWVALNGIFLKAEHWRLFGKGMVREGAQSDADMSVFAINDPVYFEQSSYSDTAALAVRYVRRHAVEGHRIALLGYSRGGVSVAQIADRLADAGDIDAAYTMAAPAGPIDIDAQGVRGLVYDMARSPVRDDEGRLARSIGLTAARRLIMYPQGTAREIQAVCAIKDTGSRLAELSQRDKGALPMGALYYREDGVVETPRHLGYLSAAGYAAPVEEQSGSHIRPLTSPATRATLIERARHDVLDQAA